MSKVINGKMHIEAVVKKGIRYFLGATVTLVVSKVEHTRLVTPGYEGIILLGEAELNGFEVLLEAHLQGNKQDMLLLSMSKIDYESIIAY